MQLMWQSRGRLRVLNARERPARLGIAAAITIFSLAVFSAGVMFSRSVAGLVSADTLKDTEQRLVQAQSRLEDQDDRLRAYAIQLSRMQAHIIRLDALGRQLTSVAGLDPRDFSFDKPPAQGGRDPDHEPQADPQMHDFGQAISALSRSIEHQQTQMGQLADLVINTRSRELASPDKHPVTSGYISSYFGKRTDPLTGRSVLHKGLDYAASQGVDVFAVADGVVTVSRYFGGFGNFVEINHGRGIVTRYAHNQENLVKPGQRVERGQRIALLGATGRATGPNLHFEVLRDGNPVDPMKFIGEAAR